MKNIHDVVNSGLCIGCGVCAFSDKVNTTVYSKSLHQSVPLLTRNNKKDELAFGVCPGKGYDIIKAGDQLYDDAPYDFELGHVYGNYAAHSKDPVLLKNASSGGVMSQIAIYLLEKGYVDRVLTTKFVFGSEPRTASYLASSREDILASQGSKYCPVDLSEAIREIKLNDYRVAVIGTPCQIAGIRNIQERDELFKKKVLFTIGNFCGGIKNYNNINKLANRLGVDSRRIDYFRFRGNGQPGSMLMRDSSGRQAEVRYPKYVALTGISKHLRCHLCVDATGELCDIACGDAWISRFLSDKDPWSIILTRNRSVDTIIKDMIKEDIFETAEVTLEEIRQSQRGNLLTKKVRQKSRYFLYSHLGYRIPGFDGGYLDNQLRIWMELKVYFSHKTRSILEQLSLLSFASNLKRKIRKMV